jgi:hypothetical protein
MVFYWTTGIVMSSISASGIGQGLMQFLQQIATEGPSATTEAASSSAASAVTTLTSGTPATGTQATAHHHHHGGGSKIKQIQDAVTTALQAAQASGNTEDPNTIIKSAIEQVLDAANNATPTTSTGTSTTETTSGTASTPQSQFEQTLQSYGVNPQQFQSDFLAAVKDAQGGQVNTANVFGSFPTGSQVDTTG